MIDRRHRSRRGAMMIVVIVCLSIASLLLLTMVKQFALAKRAAELDVNREQAAWLVESGIERAAAQLQADDTYMGETWRIDADELSGDSASIAIKVSEVADRPGHRKTEVTAEYPSGERAISATKTIFIDLPTSGAP